jgi:preprotein translocase subunit SecA
MAMSNQWGKSLLDDEYFKEQDKKNKYYRELMDKLPAYSSYLMQREHITKEELANSCEQAKRKLSIRERLARIGYENYIVNQLVSQYEHNLIYGNDLGLEDCFVNIIEALVNHNKELTGMLTEARMKQPIQCIIPKDSVIIENKDERN